MNDIEKYQKEKEQILEEIKTLEQRKNELIIRLAEIQGVFKFLKEKEGKK